MGLVKGRFAVEHVGVRHPRYIMKHVRTRIEPMISTPFQRTDPRRLFEQESEELRLSPRFKSLLEPFVPKNTPAVSAQPLPA